MRMHNIDGYKSKKGLLIFLGNANKSTSVFLSVIIDYR